MTIPYYAVLFKSGATFSSGHTKVNENGEFSFNNLDPGSYSLHETTHLNVTFTTKGESAIVKRGETTTVTLYSIYCPEIRLISPVGNAVMTTSKPTFEWHPYGQGSWYVVRIYGDLDGKPGGASMATLAKTVETNDQYIGSLASGDFTWRVCIKKPSGQGYAVCSLEESFRVNLP